jgi:hypothetical protein
VEVQAMSTRRTKVEWDPTLTRVEHLDDKGQTYFCSFEKNDDQAAEAGVAPAGDNGAAPFPATAIRPDVPVSR